MRGTKGHYFAYRSFQPEFKAMKRFAATGLDTICFMPGNTANSLGQPYAQYPAVWRWYGRYDFGSLDKQIEDIKATGKDRQLICIVDLNSPEWLSRQLSLAHESGDSFTHLSEALANPRWKEATIQYLKDFLDYCEDRHSGCIKAYVLACGHTDEWFDHNGEICGLHKERAYQQWRAGKNLKPCNPPSAIEMNSPEFDGLLFDPATSPHVIEYRKFCSELVGDTICEFARIAREHIRKTAEIGVFYGYVMTRLGCAESGHCAYSKVVKSPDIDFLISPGSYGDRAMGGGGGWLGCSGTEKLAGKVHMHECDQRTHTHNRDLTPYVTLNVPHWENTAEDVAGIKREFSLALTKRSSLWWFDMWGGFYEEPVLFENFRRMKQIYDEYINTPTVNMEETALIVDVDGLCYFDQRSPRQNETQQSVRRKMNRLGAPYESYCFSDIPDIPNLDRIKFVVMMCQWEITPEKAEILNRYILNSGRVVLWLYAPGLSDGKKLDPARVRTWAGVPQDTEGLAVTEMNGWTSAFLGKPAELTPAMLKSLAAKAGVHLYTGCEIPVYADGTFLAVHAKDVNSITLSLPEQYSRVTELFSGRTVAENTGSIEWNFTAPDSALFKLEK